MITDETKEKATMRRCGAVVKEIALNSGDLVFKTHFAHILNFILVVPDSSSRLDLRNWFASVQLGWL